MKFVHFAFTCTMLAALLGLASCQTPQDNNNAKETVKEAAKAEKATAQIYMFRGGFAGVFSTGITEMAEELRARGIPAQDLSWAASDTSLSKIKRSVSTNPKSRPIILAGHSLGAGSVVRMARELTSQDIPVDLVIVFDSLGGGTVPKGVKKLMSFKASGNIEKSGSFRPGKGFTGRIVSVDIRTLPELEESSHWNIVNQEELQKQVIREIERTYRRYNR